MTLEVTGLTAGYGSAVVVRDVSLRVGVGEAIAILGKNGMGKTTLIRAIMGYLPISPASSVRIFDQEVRGWSPHRIVRLGVGYGPQDAALFGELTVGENLRLANLRIRDFTRRRDEALAHFPALASRFDQRSGTLSGGEQKMLILARALTAHPQLLILDEVSEGLQPSLLKSARAALASVMANGKCTLLLVEQNVDFALSVVDRVVVLERGAILFERSVTDPGVREDIVRAFAL